MFISLLSVPLLPPKGLNNVAAASKWPVSETVTQPWILNSVSGGSGPPNLTAAMNPSKHLRHWSILPKRLFSWKSAICPSRKTRKLLSSTKTPIHSLSWNGFWMHLEATEWALRNSCVQDGHHVMTAGSWAQIQGCLSLLITSSTIFFQAYVHCSRYGYLTFKCPVRLQVGRESCCMKSRSGWFCRISQYGISFCVRVCVCA